MQILKIFRDFFLQVFDHTHLLYLVSDSQRLSFSQELTPTLALGLSLGLGLGLDWGHFQNKKFFIYTSFKDFSLDVYDDSHVLHLVSDSQRLSFSQELTANLTLRLSLGLGLGLGLGWGHFPAKKFFILTSFEDFYLEVFDDTHVLHLVSDSQRSSFSQELIPTLTLGWSWGLAWGHFQDIKFFIYTSFKDFSLKVYNDTNLLHLISDSQRLSFSQELTPTLTLGLSLGLGLGLAWGDFQNKNFFLYTSFKDFTLNVYDDTNLFHLVSDSQRLSFSQELTPTLTLGLSLGLGLGLAWGHFQNKYFFVFTSFKDFSLNVYDDTNLLHLVWDSQRLSFSQELTPTLTLGLSLGLGLGLAWGDFQNKYFFVFTSFKDFSLNVYDDTNLLHLVLGSECFSFSQELTPTLTLGLSLGLGLGLAWSHFQDKKFSIYTSFKDFSLDIYDDSQVLQLVPDSQRLSFSQELTPTLTLGLSLGLAWGHFQDKNFSIYFLL